MLLCGKKVFINYYFAVLFFSYNFTAMKKIVVAIDGYSSCGKSTLAKQLAKALNYVFIDSGAMYRAISLYFLRNKIDVKNDAAITTALNNIHLQFEYNVALGKSDMLLNN